MPYILYSSLLQNQAPINLPFQPRKGACQGIGTCATSKPVDSLLGDWRDGAEDCTAKRGREEDIRGFMT